MYETIMIITTVLNIVFIIVNTYWAYKRTCYNRDVYKGSKEYWNSWQDRSKDVAKTVLKEITTTDLEKELSSRYAKRKKKRQKSR